MKVDGVNHRRALEEVMDGVCLLGEGHEVEEEEGAEEGVLAAQYARNDGGGEAGIGNHNDA